MDWLNGVLIIALLIWLASVLATLLFVPFKLFHAIRSKRMIRFQAVEWAIFAYALLLPFAVFGPPLPMLIDYEIYGVLTHPTTVWSEDSERSFNGDGSSYEIRRVSNWTKNRMIHTFQSGESIPNQKSTSDGWVKFKWEKYHGQLQKEIDFALSWSDGMDEKFAQIASHDLWIAAEVRYHGGQLIGDTYIYVLDATTNELYELNANT